VDKTKTPDPDRLAQQVFLLTVLYTVVLWVAVYLITH
jgi:hypothetical protein